MVDIVGVIALLISTILAIIKINEFLENRPKINIEINESPFSIHKGKISFLIDFNVTNTGNKRTFLRDFTFSLKDFPRFNFMPEDKKYTTLETYIEPAGVNHYSIKYLPTEGTKTSKEIPISSIEYEQIKEEIKKDLKALWNDKKPMKACLTIFDTRNKEIKKEFNIEPIYAGILNDDEL